MSRRRLVSNMAWNWAGTVVEAATGFVLAPLLVRHLGESNYGLWVLLGSMASYMGLLDLGVRGSVGRYVAYHRAHGDVAAVRAVVRAGFVLSSAAAAVVLLLAFGLDWAFFRLFAVGAETSPHLRLALWLVVLNLAFSLPLSLFDAVLWGAQRFDRINQIGIPAAVIRLVLAYWVVKQGLGLAGLAGSALLVTLGTGAARFFAARNVERAAFAGGGPAGIGEVKTLLGYGLPLFVITISRMSRLQLVPALVGWAMGPASVTHYSLSRRLVDYAEGFVVSFTGVVTPAFTLLQAKGEAERQASFFVLGGRLATAVGLLFGGFAFCLGGPFLSLWLGPRWGEFAPLLWILAAGEVMPLSQSVTGNMLLGVARHRLLAGLLVVEVVTIGVLAVPFAMCQDLVGVCLVLAAASTVFRGLLVLAQGCRVVGMRILRYAASALVPALATSGTAAAGLWLIVRLNPPTTWIGFVVDLGGYAVMAAGTLLLAGGPGVGRVLIARVAGEKAKS